MLKLFSISSTLIENRLPSQQFAQQDQVPDEWRQNVPRESMISRAVTPATVTFDRAIDFVAAAAVTLVAVANCRANILVV